MSSYGGQRGRGGRGGRGGDGPRGRGGGGGSFGGGRGRGGGGAGGYASPQVYSSSTGVPAPDPSVTKVEDALQSGKGADLSSLSLREPFPRRPGYGTKGTSVVLWANYFAVTAAPKLVLHRYDVSVTPAVTGKKLAQVVRLVLQSPALAPLKDDLVSDFKSTLLSRKKLDDQTIPITYMGEDEDTPSGRAAQHQVKLQYTNELSVSELIDFLTSTNVSAQYGEKLPMIQAFNIFLNHYARNAGTLTTIGSSKTFSLRDDADKWNLNGSLVAIRGFFTSVRAATARILVNVNVSHGAFYEEGPLDKFVMNFGSQHGLMKLQKFLDKLAIRTTHLKERKNKSGKVIIRPKRIFGLANKNDGHGLQHPPKVKAFGCGPKDVEFWLDAPATSSTTSTPPPVPGASSGGGGGGKKKKGGKGGKPEAQPSSAGGKYISVYDFFANTHGIKIANPNMPVINVGNRANPMYLPLQVCYVIAGQPAKTSLDPTQTQGMIRFAVRRPAENANSIVKDGLSTAGLLPNSNPLLAKFGVSVSPNLITVSGRVLVSPKLVYKQNKQVNTAGGSWNMVPRDSPSLKFNAGGSLQKWACLYIDMPRAMYPHAHSFDSNALQDLMKRFHAVLLETGIAASPPLSPQRLQLNGTDDPNLEPMIQKASSGLQLLFIILPHAPIPLYNRIKQLGDVKYGIHTICSVGTKIAKPQGQDQYFRNEALKFNLKLGGSNQLVDPSRLGIIAEDKTMVVGIDVTHPSPGSHKLAPSVAGMVASVDRYLGQWPATVRLQSKQRQEMVSDLTDMFKSRLKLWREKGKHSALPENILIYRDGVSEGQYETVLNEELPLIRKACEEMYPATDQKKGLPRLTIVIVGKRHHTRFYPTKESDADRSGNTKSGTVVDRGVTEARSWDFFLQAHTALQGTARPAHYYVILDEIFRPKYAKAPGKNISDELQDLTQSMCYVFGRATKAVSICTPAYYADILCERARCYLSGLFETPSNSAAPSVAESAAGGGPDAGASTQDLQIHARLRDTMFYI